MFTLCDLPGESDNLCGIDIVCPCPRRLLFSDDVVTTKESGQPAVVRRRETHQPVTRGPSSRVSALVHGALRRLGEFPLHGARWQHYHRHAVH